MIKLCSTAVVVMLLLSPCYSETTVAEYLAIRKSIGRILEFSEKIDDINKAFEENLTRPFNERKANLDSAMRSDNLSGFLTKTPMGKLKRYGIFSDEFLMIISIRLRFHQSLVMEKDIHDLKIEKDGPGNVSGSFQFEVLNSIKGYCLFHARKTKEGWVVKKLVISKYAGTNSEGGLVVFDRTQQAEPIGSNTKPSSN